MRLMPKKHVKLNNSVLGFAPLVYKEWNLEKSIDDNIRLIQQKYNKSSEDIVLCLDFLFCIGKIELDLEKGLIKL